MKLAIVLISTLVIIAYIAMLLIIIIQGNKIKVLKKENYKVSEVNVYLTERQIKVLKENKLLKKQIAHDPMTPVKIISQKLKVKEIKKTATIGLMPLEEIDSCLRDAVLTESASNIKIIQNPIDLTATATLLIAENEEDM